MAEAGHQSGTLPRNRLSADARDPEFQSAGRHVAAEGEENGRDHKRQRLGSFRHIVQRPPYVCEISEVSSPSVRKRNPLSVLRRRWRVSSDGRSVQRAANLQRLRPHCFPG